jgi:hypothetical protein
LSSFEKALLAAERALELFGGGPEATHDFHVKTNEEFGILTIKDYEVHIKDTGPSRIMRGFVLVGSYRDPVEAVVEVMGLLIGDRTKTVLRQHFQHENIG